MDDYQDFEPLDEQVRGLADKLNAMDAKLDKLKTEIWWIAVAVMGVAAMIYFKWP